MFLFIHTKIVYKHVICNLALSQIIRLYYVLQFIWKQLTIMYESSNVYSSLLDASQAFDRVHWGILFKILIERKVSFLVIRILLDSFLRQLSCVVWGLFKSRYFSLGNWVKQDGVLLPMLVTIYIDKLLIRLKHAHISYE